MDSENALATTRQSADAGARFILTHHARNRLDQRRISQEAVTAALRFGRKVHARGAVFYAIGRREVNACLRHGIDIRDHLNIQVVCTPEHVVLTAYRSGNFRPMRSKNRPKHERRPS